jgi:hypothetical protein
MKMAEEGATPSRLPHTPAYSARPPPACSRARMPPPERIACSRVLMVSIGYRAVGWVKGGEEDNPQEDKRTG